MLFQRVLFPKTEENFNLLACHLYVNEIYHLFGIALYPAVSDRGRRLFIVGQNNFAHKHALS